MWLVIDNKGIILNKNSVFNELFELTKENVFQIEITYNDLIQIETSANNENITNQIEQVLREYKLQSLLDWKSYLTSQAYDDKLGKNQLINPISELTFRDELNKTQTFEFIEQLLVCGKKSYFCIRISFNSLLNKDTVILTIEPINVDKQQNVCLEASPVNIAVISSNKRALQHIKISLDDLIDELLEDDYKDCFVESLNEFVKKQIH